MQIHGNSRDLSRLSRDLKASNPTRNGPNFLSNPIIDLVTPLRRKEVSYVIQKLYHYENITENFFYYELCLDFDSEQMHIDKVRGYFESHSFFN